MLQTLSSQAPGGVGVGPLAPRRVRGRRESKVAYRNHPGHFSRDNASRAHPSSPEQLFSRTFANEHGHSHAEPNTDLLGYFDVHHPSHGSSHGYSNASPVVHQNFVDDNSWISISPHSYTLAANLPTSPQQNYGGNHGQSPGSEIPQVSVNGQEASWNVNTPRTSNLDSDLDGMSDMPVEKFESFDTNSMVYSAPNTAASSTSETYVFPINHSHFNPSGNQLDGLELPEEFHRIHAPFDVSSPGSVVRGSPQFLDDLSFDLEDSPVWNYGDMLYGTDGSQVSATTLFAPNQTQQTQLQNDSAALQPHIPWNLQFAQNGDYQQDANSGIVAFEPIRGTTYQTHIARQDFLDSGQSKPRYFGPDPTSPNSDLDSNSWAIVPHPPSSYAASHGSPVSHSSPKSHVSSPPRQESEAHHEHIFHSIPGPPKAKPLRGRQRGLTAAEKKQARDVREAKACWACHISKTKCSPCSPGKPCEQCDRLAGKRRFCLFSCFNDPIEHLSPILVPPYLMGHFTKANVETFVTNNASSWGTQYMCIRMDWGYRKFLEADVVALALRSSSSEMGFHHQTVSNGTDRPQLVRKQSPPLGIPLAAMDEMQDSYSKYIQDIVQSDVGQYIPTAYVDQQSDLPERLLGAVASYYSAGNASDNESVLLRSAIEMHVTSVILERSLFLDPESLHKVQDHLGLDYPKRSAPRCAQRQIKLAFFLLQQRRIQMVLKDWGSMMWATNSGTPKDKEWAIAFAVFLILILVMDKTLGAAYYFCEGRIKHHGHQAATEREAFQSLVRVTQNDLFERCKEIFHWKFKTRKGGKEACNPIRDGMDAFQGKTKSVDGDVVGFVRGLRQVVGDFEQDVRSHRSTSRDAEPDHTNAGRLACIFLDDFLSH